MRLCVCVVGVQTWDILGAGRDEWASGSVWLRETARRGGMRDARGGPFLGFFRGTLTLNNCNAQILAADPDWCATPWGGAPLVVKVE